MSSSSTDDLSITDNITDTKIINGEYVISSLESNPDPIDLEIVEPVVTDHQLPEEDLVDKKPEVKKRGPPSAFIKNQQKYNEVRDKEKKLLEASKKKSKAAAGSLTNSTTAKNLKSKTEPTVQTQDTTDMIRVNVGGKFKYVSKSESVIEPKITEEKVIEEKVIEPKVIEPKVIEPKVTTSESYNPMNRTKRYGYLSNTDPTEKKIEPKSSKIVPDRTKTDPVIYNRETVGSAVIDRDKGTTNVARMRDRDISKTAFNSRPVPHSMSTSKIPSKYAKEMEKTVKTNTVKNVKNFSELRRVKLAENLDVTDTQKSTMNELRKLNMVQKQKDFEEAKKKNSNESKRESAVQQVMNDESLSKFAKAVKIKSMSTSSRQKIRRENPLAKRAQIIEP